MIRAIVTLLVLGFVGMTVLGLLFGLVAPLRTGRGVPDPASREPDEGDRGQGETAAREVTPDAEEDPATTRRVVPRMAFREPAPDRWRTSIPSL